MIKKAKEIQQNYRSQKTKVIERTKTYVLFIDFAKAFDKVNRVVLSNKLK